MSEQIGTYPEHLYDRSRIELATELIEKETRKLLLDVPQDAWSGIDGSVRGWAHEPERYHLEGEPLQDFWDIFSALMESVKLKSNFTSLITAENAHWSRKAMNLRELQMTSPIGDLHTIPGIEVRSDLPFAEVLDALATHPEIVSEKRDMVDRHSADPAQDLYPIIVRKAEAGLYKVMDGNRRALKAAVYGQDSIDAWVCELDGDKAVNFWVPMNDMFQLLKVFKGALDDNNKELQVAVARVLHARFQESSVAKRAYQNRIASQHDIARQLLKLALQI